MPFSPGSAAFTLGISSLILNTLRDTARISQLPYLHEAAILALGILDVIQDMKECREGFQRLASDVCGLVSSVIEARSGDNASADILQQDMEKLIMRLTSILDFAKRELSKSRFRRMINHSADRGKIAEYREVLRQSLDVFGLTSTVSTREDVIRIVQHQNELLRELRELRGLLLDKKEGAGLGNTPLKSMVIEFIVIDDEESERLRRWGGDHDLSAGA